MRDKTSQSLDGWRGLAILGVIAGHFSYQTSSDLRPIVGDSLADWFYIFSSKSIVGVLFFFCLSGYLVTKSFIESPLPVKARCQHFLLRRASRILPMLFVFLATLLALHQVGYLKVQPRGVLSSLFFVRNWNPGDFYTTHLWSLSVEAHFYLLCPFLLYGVLKSRRPFAVLLLLTAAATAWRFWEIQHRLKLSFGLPAGGESTDYYLCVLLSGVLLNFRPPGWDRVFSRWPVFALALAACFAPYNAQFPLAGYVQVLSPCLLLSCLIANPTHAWAAPFRSRPLVFLGTISYSLYLWQQIFLRPVAGNLVLNLGFCVLLSWATHRWIEEPFRKLPAKPPLLQPPLDFQAVRRLI
jgi:peptidoglycan/LPS O-acetylase OafA/YrhL